MSHDAFTTCSRTACKLDQFLLVQSNKLQVSNCGNSRYWPAVESIDACAELACLYNRTTFNWRRTGTGGSTVGYKATHAIAYLCPSQIL